MIGLPVCRNVQWFLIRFAAWIKDARVIKFSMLVITGRPLITKGSLLTVKHQQITRLKLDKRFTHTIVWVKSNPISKVEKASVNE